MPQCHNLADDFTVKGIGTINVKEKKKYTKL